MIPEMYPGLRANIVDLEQVTQVSIQDQVPVNFDVDMYYSGDYPVSDQSWVLIRGICLRNENTPT